MSFSAMSEWEAGTQGPQMYVGTNTTNRHLESRQGRDPGISDVRSIVTRDERDAQISDDEKCRVI